MGSRAMHKYTVIFILTNAVIAQGSAEECAEQMDITVKSFYSLISRINNGTNRKYKIIIE